jgi:hypothetical protein
MWSVKGAVRAKEERVRPRLFSPVFVGGMAAAVLVVAAFGTGTIVGMRYKQVKKQNVAVKSAPASTSKNHSDIATKSAPSTEPAVEPVSTIAAGPEQLDRAPGIFRGPEKNKRRNRRDREAASSSVSGAESTDTGQKVPIAPEPGSPNSADLGKLGTADNNDNSEGSQTTPETPSN